MGEFKEEICHRFGEILLEDAVEEFNKLIQIGIVEDFWGNLRILKHK